MSKLCIKIEKVEPSKCLIVDAFNPTLQGNTPEDREVYLNAFLRTYLPYNTLYKEICVKNFFSLPKTLVSALANQYIHGTKITISTPAKNCYLEYTCKCPTPYYNYKWVPFSFKDAIPRSLAEFTWTENGNKYVYLDEIQKLKNVRYIPNHIWRAVDMYSQKRIQDCKNYNLGYYPHIENWFKRLLHDLLRHDMSMFSPNSKTYLEVTAERECQAINKAFFTLAPGEQPLTDQELVFLHKYAPAYGVDIPQQVLRFATHKTKHGYTAEPEYCFAPIPESDVSRCIYDYRNAEKGVQLPAFVRKQLMPRVSDNDKLLRDAYTTLTWIMQHAAELPNNGLIDGYAICPVCGELYHESQGCDCGAVDSVTFVSAPNLFYGDAASYEELGLINDIVD